MEETVRSQAMDFLRSHGIPFVDALPALRESLARGVQPYKESPDGHPNPAGHRVIADVVAEEMERRGLAGNRLPAHIGARLTATEQPVLRRKAV